MGLTGTAIAPAHSRCDDRPQRRRRPAEILPLVELDAPVRHATTAIAHSGNGGRRDLDEQIGDTFRKDGVPTIGVDSPRSFRPRKTPAPISADPARIIDLCGEKWGVDRVVLVGYSFGADTVPAAFGGLPAEEKSQVVEMSLLGLADQVDDAISAGAFLGTGAGDVQVLANIGRMKPVMIHCFHDDEDDSLCPKLEGSGVELIKTTGGHHFDGDYEALARRVRDGLGRRLPGAPARPAGGSRARHG